MMVSFIVQGVNDFRCEFDVCGHVHHHTRPYKSVKAKPQLVPVSSIDAHKECGRQQNSQNKFLWHRLPFRESVTFV
jgi:hypothetical protein